MATNRVLQANLTLIYMTTNDEGLVEQQLSEATAKVSEVDFEKTLREIIDTVVPPTMQAQPQP